MINLKRPGKDLVLHTQAWVFTEETPDPAPDAPAVPTEARFILSHGSTVTMMITGVGNVVVNIDTPADVGAYAYMTRDETRRIVNALVAMLRETRELPPTPPSFIRPATIPPAQMAPAQVLAEVSRLTGELAQTLRDTGEWPRVTRHIERLTELTTDMLSWRV